MINDIDYFLENIFSAEEFRLFENISQNTVNEKALAKTGKVETTRKEVDGVVTEVVSYDSFDGKESFKKVHVYEKANEHDMQIKQINEKIALAVQIEDFEQASKLKTEKQNLINAIR